MPHAIDESKMQQGSREQIITLDPAKPPTKFIPHADFPRVVYLHPVKPFVTIEHRNVRQELVNEEIVPTEHDTLVVNSEEELEKAITEGWVKDPYIPKAPKDPKAGIYLKKKPA